MPGEWSSSEEPAGRPPVVVVVIPTRDRPRSLAAAVGSVLAQETARIEVVVVDDASAEAVETTHPDPRVRVVRNDSARGPAACRNQGAAASSAPFVAFLDDDDLWLPDKLTTALACLGDHPEAGTLVHRAAFAGERKRADGSCRLLENPVRRLLTQGSPHPDCVVVRREVHDRVRFDEEFPAAADLDYMLRLAQTAPVVLLDKVLAVHRPLPTAPSGISMDARIAGRQRFRAKHAAVFAADRRGRAFHHVRLGHLQRRAGRPLAAGRSYLRAVMTEPRELRAWKGLGRVGLIVAGGRPRS